MLTYDKRKYIAAPSPKQEDLLTFWYFILDQKVLTRSILNSLSKFFSQVSTIVMFPIKENCQKINYLPEQENSWMDIDLGIRILVENKTTVNEDLIQR